jgi:hypothetical protein
MSAEVIPFPGDTLLDLDPDGVLKSNVGEFKTVVLIGVGNDDLLRCCASTADVAEAIFLLERAKLALLKTIDDD